MRVFSWDLPFHEAGATTNKRCASGPLNLAEILFYTKFYWNLRKKSRFLIRQGWLDPTSIGVAGLSRGGFIATHFAAQEPRFIDYFRIRSAYSTASLRRIQEFDDSL